MTTRTRNFLALALTTLTAPAGCDLPDDAELAAFGAGDVAERCTNCGIKFNNFAWGNVDGGELDRRGELWAGAVLVKVELKCNPKEMGRFPKICKDAPSFVLGDKWAEDGQLIGTRDGLKFAGADFLGSTWTIDLYEGKQFVRRHVQVIDKYEHNPQQKPHSLHYYTFNFWGDGSNGGEKGILTPACKETADPVSGAVVGTRALVFEDITVDTTTGVISKRADTLYFGCIAAAVGKAGNWGYPSWDVGPGHFTAAVRSVRADYCGDGQSYTTKGQALQVADVWDYNGFVDPLRPVEAVFGEKGASCLGTPRWSLVDYLDVTCSDGHPPKKCPVGVKMSDYPEAIIHTLLP